MQHNTDPTFVGLPRLKARHAAQVAEFEQWAAAGAWASFHASHYDWWAFPIDRPSSYGRAWTVYAGDIAELNADPAFVERYLAGHALLAASWGWDLAAADFLPDPAPDQCWQQWPVRLHKAGLSARLFGHAAVFDAWQTYATILLDHDQSFVYGRHDLSWLFTGQPDPWQA